jgi:hypothetical protein
MRNRVTSAVKHNDSCCCCRFMADGYLPSMTGKPLQPSGVACGQTAALRSVGRILTCSRQLTQEQASVCLPARRCRCHEATAMQCRVVQARWVTSNAEVPRSISPMKRRIQRRCGIKEYASVVRTGQETDSECLHFSPQAR